MRQPLGTFACLSLHFVAFLAPPTLAAFGHTSQGLLERARRATGTWSEAGLRIEGQGEAHASGTDGQLALALTPDGSFRFEFQSRLPECAAFDGEVVWTRDRTGLERVLELQEADQLKLFYWVLSGHWLEAEEVQVRELEGAGEASSRLALRLIGTPMEMTLELDPRHALPAVLTHVGDAGTRVWTFADYAEVAGRRLPRRWTFDGGVGEERYRIDSFQALAPEAGRFRRPLAPIGDVIFDSEIPSELEVTRMPSGHLLVEPLIDNEFLGAFAFDTGAGITVIDESVADQLSLETLGHTLAVGVGGSTTSHYRRGETFQLGPLVIENPIYGDLDLSFLQAAFGRKVIGIVGYDLLARCVVELESAAPRVALHDPAKYTLPRGRWQDLVLHESTPCVAARFEGDRQGLFRIDTGATGTVTFHAPAVAELDLLAGRDLRSSRNGGVGGTTASSTGVLAWFELAGHRFEQPSVSFSHATEGAFADVYITGNIGQDFMRPFALVLDFPHDRIAFVPLVTDR